MKVVVSAGQNPLTWHAENSKISMDPISALGLASNVLRSVHFGGKFILGGLEVYSSVDNSSSVIRDSESITEDLTENL